MKYLIAGLGNIGDKYIHTRHNIGFIVLDALARASNTFFSDQRYGAVAHFKVKNKQAILLKPNTYMNLSGESIRYWMQHEKIPIENLLVVTDDLALPEGKIRLKAKGSDGGHNGLRNIQEIIGSQAYARLRFGVGNDFEKGRQVDYVLSPWNSDELLSLQPRIELATDAIQTFMLSGIEFAMNKFNNA